MAQFDPQTGERIDVTQPKQASAPKQEQSKNPEPSKGESGPQKGGK